jgi:GDPmannose 4,6-dehydratase
LFACSGILFNHESALRPERFVTQKIVQAAVRIARGSGETLELGNMDISRDWGWAPEYVDAMWRMLQADKPQDLVIATGHTHALKDFVEHVFKAAGLDWRAHVKSNPALYRPSEIMVNRADPARARAALGWQAQTLMPQVAARMVEAALGQVK